MSHAYPGTCCTPYLRHGGQLQLVYAWHHTENKGMLHCCDDTQILDVQIYTAALTDTLIYVTGVS